MSNFIKAKGREIVNLDKVTYIHPCPNCVNEYEEICHKIYFYFDSIRGENILDVVWVFEKKHDYDKVMSFLNRRASEVL